METSQLVAMFSTTIISLVGGIVYIFKQYESSLSKRLNEVSLEVSACKRDHEMSRQAHKVCEQQLLELTKRVGNLEGAAGRLREAPVG